MRSPGGTSLRVLLPVTGALLLASGATAAPIIATAATGEEGKPHPLIHTDGTLRPGRMETIRVEDFPGEGKVEIAFFPTAICESECGAVARKAGRTDADGSGRLRVRVPGYFFNAEERRTYFRDRERVDLIVIWEGPGKDEFAVGSPRHDPVLRRSHKDSP
jgi:hypothetical protein